MLDNIYNPEKLSYALFSLSENNDYTNLEFIRSELNKVFDKSYCKEVLYTNNTDRLFFGIKVYPAYNGDTIASFFGDYDYEKIPDNYYVEFDSKLFNPLLCLDENELLALTIYEIYNVIYNNDTKIKVKSAIDLYSAKVGDNTNYINTSKSYRELLSYAIKDSISKTGSIFTKIGNEEIDYNVPEREFGNLSKYLFTAVNKLTNSEAYLNKAVDPILIALSWVLRFRNEFNIRRASIFKTLLKATELSASQLEKRSLVYISKIVSKMDDPISESAIDNIKNRFSKKFSSFKLKGIRLIKDDVYELNLRLRCANEMEDLMYIIRTANTDIAILQDYLTEDIDDYERKSCEDTLQELYSIRQKAAKEKNVRDKSDSLISIYYPNIE